MTGFEREWEREEQKREEGGEIKTVRVMAGGRERDKVRGGGGRSEKEREGEGGREREKERIRNGKGSL